MTPSGIDTLSLAFRPEGTAAVDAFRGIAHRPSKAGGLVLEDHGPDGGRLLCWPSHYVMAYETRLAALLEGDLACHDLAPASAVPAGASTARAIIFDLIGADVGKVAEVRRFDLAAELRFDAPAEGLSFLQTVGGMCPARHRVTQEIADDGTLMTAYHRTAKRGVIAFRCYDKGRESGSDPPGLRIRLERQNRPPKRSRYTADTFATLDLRENFSKTMSYYLDAEEVVCAGPDAATAHLVGKALNGELSFAKAQSLAGSIAFLKFGGRAAFDRLDTSRKANNDRSARRLRALRQAGIALEDELPPDATVPVSDLIRQAVEEFRA